MDGGLTLPLAPVRVCGIVHALGSVGRMGRADGAVVETALSFVFA